jgi:radical SAM protein with 4Fe4S-binding SPASM domain
VSVSVDGLETSHDLIRANRGSYVRALEAIGHLRRAGLAVSANTNLNRLNANDVEALYDVLRDAGIASWQVQVTAPLGRAADRADLVLQPYDYVGLMPRIAKLKTRAFRDGILLMPGNNLGYFGPEEGELRSVTPDGDDHFQGCMAGRFVLGIESDGAVKGCPSLQTKHYVGGSLNETPLRRIFEETPELGFTRRERTDELWGFCASCPYASVCQGGCSFTAEAILGRRGNNPYCSYRAGDFHRRGLRERLVPSRPAEGRPFDNGTFAIVVEPFDAPDPRPAARRDLVRIRRAKIEDRDT